MPQNWAVGWPEQAAGQLGQEATGWAGQGPSLLVPPAQPGPSASPWVRQSCTSSQVVTACILEHDCLWSAGQMQADIASTSRVFITWQYQHCNWPWHHCTGPSKTGITDAHELYCQHMIMMTAHLAGTGAAVGLAAFGWLTPATLCHFRMSALHMHKASLQLSRVHKCNVQCQSEHAMFSALAQFQSSSYVNVSTNETSCESAD